jgi:hypothetical protein
LLSLVLLSPNARTTVIKTDDKEERLRKVYQKREFKLWKEDLYPEWENLFGRYGERRYLDELRNPFNTIMGQEFPDDMWRGWDVLLMRQAPLWQVDSYLDRRQPT